MANNLVKEDYVSSGNQHIHVPYHWVKELQKRNVIDVSFVHGKANLADLFTKPVSKQVIDALLHKMLGYDTSWYDSDAKKMDIKASNCVLLCGHVIG